MQLEELKLKILQCGNGVSINEIMADIEATIDFAITDYQTNEEQRHIASAVESERERIIAIASEIEKLELELKAEQTSRGIDNTNN